MFTSSSGMEGKRCCWSYHTQPLQLTPGITEVTWDAKKKIDAVSSSKTTFESLEGCGRPCSSLPVSQRRAFDETDQRLVVMQEEPPFIHSMDGGGIFARVQFLKVLRQRTKRHGAKKATGFFGCEKEYTPKEQFLMGKMMMIHCVWGLLIFRTHSSAFRQVDGRARKRWCITRYTVYPPMMATEQ